MKKLATEKQQALIAKLRAERVETEDITAKFDYIDTMGGRMTTGQASQIIDALLAAPKRNRPNIEVGARVGTPRFGRGTVLAVDGEIVTIETAQGIRKLWAGMLR